jgi:hypothetical protein
MHSHHYPPDSAQRDDKRCRCLAHLAFGGESLSRVTCKACRKTNRNVESMFDVGLHIAGQARVAGGKEEGESPSEEETASDVDLVTGQSIQDCLNKLTSAKEC